MPALIYPLLLAVALHVGGAAYWLMVPFNILLVPMLDHLVQALAPHWQPSLALRRRLYAPHWLWLYAAAQLTLLLWVLWHVSALSLTPFEYMGLVSSAGLMTGTAGITAAHELIHRRGRLERGLGLGLLAMVSYLHFRIEHVYGHHRNVGTDADMASARLGESFPAYFARSLVGGVVSAWRIEARRQRACGLPGYGIGNRCLQYLLVQTAVYAALMLIFGAGAGLFFLLQSLMAVHLLEAVNYVQHYGLRRDAGSGNEPERIGPQHAWDSTAPISALLSFNLSTHAGHHLRALQPAHELQVHATAPRLPLSFFLMVFLALLPPLWHRLMDRRARAAGGSPDDRVSVPLLQLPAYGESAS